MNRQTICKPYVGRFAPSPTGPLHAGSLVAALASWLDARGYALQHPDEPCTWLVRMEDVDVPRCNPAWGEHILQQLAQCGLVSDAPVLWQSQRSAHYQSALDQLVARSLAYPCGCSRSDIEAAVQSRGARRARHSELRYPGTCRAGLQGRTARAWRLATTPDETVHWFDRRLGAQHQDVHADVGDFVLHRADGYFSYQLAVVVDDAAQGVTHVVRGADLADNTPRQIVLQRALGLSTPIYRHTPLVLNAKGEKLSKQSGAEALDLSEPLLALNEAAQMLHLPPTHTTVSDALRTWTQVWAARATIIADSN